MDLGRFWWTSERGIGGRLDRQRQFGLWNSFLYSLYFLPLFVVLVQMDLAGKPGTWYRDSCEAFQTHQSRQREVERRVLHPDCVPGSLYRYTSSTVGCGGVSPWLG